MLKVYQYLTNFVMLCTLYQIIGIVNTLSTRQNFFASHEHVIRVGVFWVVWIRHGVKWANRQRKFIQHVEVGVVLCLNQSTQQLLVRR